MNKGAIASKRQCDERLSQTARMAKLLRELPKCLRSSMLALQTFACQLIPQACVAMRDPDAHHHDRLWWRRTGSGDPRFTTVSHATPSVIASPKDDDFTRSKVKLWITAGPP